MDSISFSLGLPTSGASGVSSNVSSLSDAAVCPRSKLQALAGRQVLLERSVRPLSSPAKSIEGPGIIMMAEEAKGQWEFKKWSVPRFLQSFWFFSDYAKTLDSLMSPSASNAIAPSVSATPSKTVLVAGATGGVGKRVVKRLVEKGYKVKCLVRNLEKAAEVLDPAADLCGGDLFNIPDEAVEGVEAVICCTGTKAGPQDDTPDRAKYYQGLKFYQPVILENTPENVEFKGIQSLMDAVLSKGAVKDSEGLVLSTIFDFSDPKVVEASKQVWGAVDDVVMGGASESFFTVADGRAIFSGRVTTDNNGGFCSWRTRAFDKPLDLSKYDGIALRVKGDGQRYKVNLRTDSNWSGMAFSQTFDTKQDEWVTVRIPFEQLKAVQILKTVEGVPFKSSNICSFQIMLSKFEYSGELNPAFTPGPFVLEIESISAYKKVPVTPQWVHVSSAGVTRPGRPDIILENEPPAVRMNEMLGRIMDWKLAGENVVRKSGIPYAIIRPCALTEQESVTPALLEVEQGDNIRGSLSREELADLCVEALELPSMVNVSFEVRRRTTAADSDTWESLVGGLEKDDAKVPAIL